MLTKKSIGVIILSLLTSSAIAAPTNNSSLKISNATKNSLSFYLDHDCSKKIDVVDAHSIKDISLKKIMSECSKNSKDCKINVFDSLNCSDKSIATLTVNTTGWGVMRIQPPFSNTYQVKANGVNLFVDGPW